MTMTYKEEFGFEPDQNEPETAKPHITRIELVEDGPLIVHGAISIILDKGSQPLDPTGPLILCRCGYSMKKPFCDGSSHAVHVDLPEGEIE